MTAGVTTFSEQTLGFLTALAAHNSKTWFDAHRNEYEAHVLEPAKAFVIAAGEALRDLAPDVHAEPRVNGSIFRINRDTRFSQDKRPYKDHLDLWFWQGRRRSRECPAYYFRLTAQGLWLGAGLHAFYPELRSAYRAAVLDADRGPALAAAVAAVRAADVEVSGVHYKRVPRGFDADHPRAELLRYNGLYADRRLDPPEELGAPEFVDLCLRQWRPLEPLQSWLAGLVDDVA